MALATVCPHCKTTFRVAADQLKLRGGIVRCGTCRQIFDGNASLIDLDSRRPTPAAPPANNADDPMAPQTIFAMEQAPEPEPAPEPPPEPKPQPEPVPEPVPESVAESVPESVPEPDAEPDPKLDHKPGPEPTPEPTPEPAPEPIPERTPAPVPQQPSASAAFDEQIAALDAAAPIKLPPGYVLDFDLSEPDDGAPLEAIAQLEPDHEPDHEPDNEPEHESDADAAMELSLSDDGDLSTDEPEDWPCPEELEKPAPEHDIYFGPLPLVRPSAASEDSPVSQFPAPPEPVRVRKVEPEPVAVVETDEPEFVRLHREKEQATRRRRLTMGAGSALLLLVLLAQGVTTFRNVLAATNPALKPVLAASCKLLGCKVELPSQIESMVLDTGELQSLGGNKFQLNTLMRNESTLTQAWPYLELELTDANDKALVRRVFTPVQYLPNTTTPAKGFNGRSEQAVKIVFELKQLKASGFHVAVFYP